MTPRAGTGQNFYACMHVISAHTSSCTANTFAQVQNSQVPTYHNHIVGTKIPIVGAHLVLQLYPYRMWNGAGFCRWDLSCLLMLPRSAQQQMLPWASPALLCPFCWCSEPTPRTHDGQRPVKSGVGSQTDPETFFVRLDTKSSNHSAWLALAFISGNIIKVIDTMYACEGCLKYIVTCVQATSSEESI